MQLRPGFFLEGNLHGTMPVAIQPLCEVGPFWTSSPFVSTEDTFLMTSSKIFFILSVLTLLLDDILI